MTVVELDITKVDQGKQARVYDRMSRLEAVFGLTVYDPVKMALVNEPAYRSGTLDLSLKDREKSRRRALKKYGVYYAPLGDIAVDVEDVEQLRADLAFDEPWKQKSGKILDILLTIPIARIEARLQTKRLPDTSKFTEETALLALLKEYQQLPQEKRWSLEGIRKLQDENFIQDAIDQYEYKYLIPTTRWRPDYPVTVYEDGDPLQLVEEFGSAINLRLYPKGSGLGDAGEDWIQSVLPNYLTGAGLQQDSQGLLQYPPGRGDVDPKLIEHALKAYICYVEDMANGFENTPRDPYYMANFGTLLLLAAQNQKPEERARYYQAAQRSFAVAKTIASTGLSPESQEDLRKNFLVREGEAALQRGLSQLYDPGNAQTTEASLKEALSLFEEHLELSPNDAYAGRLRAWTHYHLGVYYQDVRYDASLAIKFLSQALDALAALQIPEGVVTERLEKAQGVISIHTSHGVDNMKVMDHLRVLSLVEAAAQQGVTRYYKSLGLPYVNVPELVGITGACENVDTLFRVSSRTGVPLFMTQTGQLSLEQVLQAHRKGVYTVIHSGRDEGEEDARHLR